MRLFVSVDCDGLSDRHRKRPATAQGAAGAPAHRSHGGPRDDEVSRGGDHDLDALTEAIGTAVAAAAVGPFKLTLDGVGAFPSPEYIRVVWLGVGRGASELTALHRRIEAGTTALGYGEERHEFTPHVTLARMENAAAKADVQRFLRETDPEIGPLRVEELRLTESVLTDDGPEYRTVERFEL